MSSRGRCHRARRRLRCDLCCPLGAVEPAPALLLGERAESPGRPAQRGAPGRRRASARGSRRRPHPPPKPRADKDRRRPPTSRPSCPGSPEPAGRRSAPPSAPPPRPPSPRPSPRVAQEAVRRIPRRGSPSRRRGRRARPPTGRAAGTPPFFQAAVAKPPQRAHRPILRPPRRGRRDREPAKPKSVNAVAHSGEVSRAW